MNPKYLNMIRKMGSVGKREWSVYILRCGDGSLYTGIAKDVAARLKKHGNGKGAAYTRSRLPLELLYQKPRLTHSQALIREAQIKSLPRQRKEKLIVEKGIKKEGEVSVRD